MFSDDEETSKTPRNSREDSKDKSTARRGNVDTDWNAQMEQEKEAETYTPDSREERQFDRQRVCNFHIQLYMKFVFLKSNVYTPINCHIVFKMIEEKCHVKPGEHNLLTNHWGCSKHSDLQQLMSFFAGPWRGGHLGF